MALRLDQNGFIDNELADVFCCDELRMPVVDHLVNDLVDEHKVLSNAFLVEYAAVVAEDLHHAIDDVKNGRGRHVCLAGCNEVDSEFLGEEVVDSINILERSH